MRYQPRNSNVLVRGIWGQTRSTSASPFQRGRNGRGDRNARTALISVCYGRWCGGKCKKKKCLTVQRLANMMNTKTWGDGNVTELIAALHEIKKGSSDYKQLCVFRISKATVDSNKHKYFNKSYFHAWSPSGKIYNHLIKKINTARCSMYSCPKRHLETFGCKTTLKGIVHPKNENYPMI